MRDITEGIKTFSASSSEDLTTLVNFKEKNGRIKKIYNQGDKLEVLPTTPNGVIKVYTFNENAKYEGNDENTGIWVFVTDNQ